LALTAAVLFGISTPLVQRFGSGVGAFATAALLYMGAAAAGALLRQRLEHEARILSGDFPRLLAMAAAGAVVGPVALAWGLQRTGATGASLMLTLEAVFTAVLAWRMYHETMDRRIWTAMLLLMVGGALLIFNQGRAGGAGMWGLLAVLLATAAWGLDNTLSRTLAERDPGQVVLAKAVLGATAASMLAVSFGESLPAPGAALGLFAVGATGYGLTLRFYLLAQRAFGAARTGSVFAFAPFIGAALAVAMGEQSISWLSAAGSGYRLLAAQQGSISTIGDLFAFAGPATAGMFFSFGAGLVALKWLSRWLEHGQWRFFGYYCVGVSVVVLAVARLRG
jgi:drug/metabolite transporter (DMT)-like permease